MFAIYFYSNPIFDHVYAIHIGNMYVYMYIYTYILWAMGKV